MRDELKNITFSELFILKEYQTITGEKGKYYKRLSMMLFFTFLSFALTKGGLEYLNLKMNDPFVRNVEIEVPYGLSQQVYYIKKELNDTILQGQYKYNGVYTHSINMQRVFNNTDSATLFLKGRTIDPNNPILRQICSKKNLISGKPFNNSFDYGLIITQNALTKLGYKNQSNFIKIYAINPVNGKEHYVTVPLRAIVKELPGKNDLAYTPYFQNSRKSYSDDPLSNSLSEKQLTYFIPGDNEVITDIKSKLKEQNIVEKYQQQGIYIFKTENSEYNIDGQDLIVSFDENACSYAQLEEINKEIVSTVKKYNGFRKYNLIFPSNGDDKAGSDMLTINFSSLKNVREFNKYITKEYKLEMEMGSIIDKENFRVLSILTIIVSIILFAFSFFSINLFVSHLISSHLEKIKINIGTFLAFGLAKNKLIEAYRAILINKFIAKAVGTSFVLVFLLDLVIRQILRGLVESQLFLSSFFNVYFLLGVGALYMLIYHVFKKSTLVKLDQTPGELIYGR